MSACARSREGTRPRSTSNLSSRDFISPEKNLRHWLRSSNTKVPASVSVQGAKTILPQVLTGLLSTFCTEFSTGVLKTPELNHQCRATVMRSSKKQRPLWAAWVLKIDRDVC